MEITLQELINKNNPIIIDIRNENEFIMGTIPTSRNIPAIKLEVSPEKYLHKDQTYYIFCNNGKIKICSTNEQPSIKDKDFIDNTNFSKLVISSLFQVFINP